jgi:hypothetical protein
LRHDPFYGLVETPLQKDRPSCSAALTGRQYRLRGLGRSYAQICWLILSWNSIMAAVWQLWISERTAVLSMRVFSNAGNTA